MANLEITTKRGREAKANRLEDRVDAERYALSDQEFDGLVEAVQRAGLIGDRDDFDSPLDRVLAIGAIHAQDKLGTGRDRHRDLRRVEAVDRDAHTPLPESGHDGRRRSTKSCPGCIRGRSRRPLESENDRLAR